MITIDAKLGRVVDKGVTKTQQAYHIPEKVRCPHEAGICALFNCHGDAIYDEKKQCYVCRKGISRFKLPVENYGREC